MNRTLKTLLLWLLALALPVQGYAAVAKLSCGPTHHAPTAVSHVERSHLATMSTHSGFDHPHHADMTDDGVQAAAGKLDGDANAALDKTENGKCSACATCCVGGAMLPSMSNWSPVAEGSNLAISAAVSFFSGPIPDGLKRPPRSLLV